MNFSAKIRKALSGKSRHLDCDFNPDIKVDYIDYSATNPAYLSYIQADRLPLFEGSFWNVEKRKKYATHTKPHRLLKAIFPCLTEREINVLYNYLFPSESKIILLEGAEIDQTFDREKLFSDMGDLITCMVNNHDIRKYEIYRDNCKCLVLKDDKGMIHARGIVWPNVQISKTESITYLDRVYAHTKVDRDKLLEHAESQGWIYRFDRSDDEGGVNNGAYRGYKGKFEGNYLKVTLSKNTDTYERLPYMDSFKYGKINSNEICSENEKGFNTPLEDHQSGTPFGVDEDDEERIECSCGRCGFVSTDEDEFVNINGDLFRRECSRIAYSERYSEWILREDAQYNIYVHSWIYDDDDDFVTDIHGDYVLLEDCTRIQGGSHEDEYCLDTELKHCSICGNALHQDDDDCCEAEEKEETILETAEFVSE